MGKQIHLEKVQALFEKSPVVDFKSIERIVGKDGNYVKLLIHNLLKKGKIKKIGKGMYTSHNELTLAVFAFNPAYLGLQSSLSHHGIWEQETIPVIITVKKVRRGVRIIMGGNIFLRNISPNYFFGWNFIEEGNFYLPYSDLEKTFIDMIVFNQTMDRDVLKKIKKSMNKGKFLKYLKKYPRKIRERVLSVYDC